MISAVILAAGFSSRMKGRNKLLVSINDCTIIEHVIRSCLDSKFEEIIIVYKDEEIKEIACKYNLKVCYNENSEKGQSTSLICGIKNISRNSDGCMLILGDMPFVNSQIMNNIIDSFNNNKYKISVPFYNGKRGNPILVGKEYFNEILALQGDIGARNILLKYQLKLDKVEIYDELANIDIDSIDDLDKIKINYFI